jgi:hypothetical protein
MPDPQSTDKLTRDGYDDRSLYCRMLGHSLTFKYCRQTATGLFCRKVFDCWHRKLDVAPYIKSFYTEEQIQAVLRPSAPKMHSLLGLIERAKGQE